MRHKLAVAPEIDDLLDAVSAVDRERRENREVDDQYDPVERVELVKWTDVAPGFVDQIVEVTLKKGLWRWPLRRRPWCRCWCLQKHSRKTNIQSGFLLNAAFRGAVIARGGGDCFG